MSSMRHVPSDWHQLLPYMSSKGFGPDASKFVGPSLRLELSSPSLQVRIQDLVEFFFIDVNVVVLLTMSNEIWGK